MSYLRSNPLAEHNSGIALSSKDIPQNGTGNMYDGQAGRAFVQGGGGMSQFYSFNPGVADSDSAHARGSYAPVSVGINSVATCGGGSTRRKKSASASASASASRRRRSSYRRNRRVTKCKKCKCDIIIGVGGIRRHSRFCKHKCCKKTCKNRSLRVRQKGGSSGSFANAAYSIGGAQTEVTPSTTALANPAPHTAYNSCHPVV
jgi:hypothetical protein